MQWQRLLRSAAAVVGVAVIGCEAASGLHAAPPEAARPQKPDVPPAPITPASATAVDPASGGRLVATVRALVNGVPILDSELTEAALGPLAVLNASSPDYNSEVKKIKALMLDQLIDREILVQEAHKKLAEVKKTNVIEQVNDDADIQFKKWVKQASAAFKSEDEFKKYLLAHGTSYEGQKRLKRRITLAEEFLRSNVMGRIERYCGHQEIYDYYKTHPEEFQHTDSVEWQDIFIDAGDTKKYPTRRRRPPGRPGAGGAGQGDDHGSVHGTVQEVRRWPGEDPQGGGGLRHQAREYQSAGGRGRSVRAARWGRGAAGCGPRGLSRPAPGEAHPCGPGTIRRGRAEANQGQAAK